MKEKEKKRAIPLPTDAFVHRNLRAREGVLRKLSVKYGVCMPEVEAFIAPVRQPLEEGIRAFLAKPLLDNRIREAAAYSHIALSDGQCGEIKGICAHLARDCHTIFALRHLAGTAPGNGKIRRNDPDPVPQTDANAQLLEDIYAHHVIMNAMAQMKPYGLSDRSVFSIAGGVIHEMVLLADNTYTIPHKGLDVQPVKSNDTRNDALAYEEWMQRFLGFEKERKDLLSQEYHRAIRPSFVETLFSAIGNLRGRGR